MTGLRRSSRGVDAIRESSEPESLRRHAICDIRQTKGNRGIQYHTSSYLSVSDGIMALFRLPSSTPPPLHFLHAVHYYRIPASPHNTDLLWLIVGDVGADERCITDQRSSVLHQSTSPSQTAGRLSLSFIKCLAG